MGMSVAAEIVQLLCDIHSSSTLLYQWYSRIKPRAYLKLL